MCWARVTESWQSFDHFMHSRISIHLSALCLPMQFVTSYHMPLAAYGRLVCIDERFILFIISRQNVFQCSSARNHPFRCKQWKNWLWWLFVELQSPLYCFPIECFGFRIPYTFIVPSTSHSFDNDKQQQQQQRATGGISYGACACNSIRIKLLEGKSVRCAAGVMTSFIDGAACVCASASANCATPYNTT